MNSLGTADVFVIPKTLGGNTSEIISRENVGWTPSGNRTRSTQDAIPFGRYIERDRSFRRNVYIPRDRPLGTDLEMEIQAASLDVVQDICFDDVMGALLKGIDGKFDGALKQKIIDKIKHAELIETALLSRSSLAKDWMTPAEDEAWKDL
jgi:hypothetical protein